VLLRLPHCDLTGKIPSRAMLRVLLSAELIAREPGGRYALHGYRLSDAGLSRHRAMRQEKII
jgi:hypothetical protein